MFVFPGPKLQGQSDFGSMDMPGVSDVAGHLNMDSDDLVPSLQVRPVDLMDLPSFGLIQLL